MCGSFLLIRNRFNSKLRSIDLYPQSFSISKTKTITTMSSSTISVSEKVQPELDKGLDCWSVFSPASGHMPSDSLNLGQGFMNWAPPEFMKQAAKDSIDEISANHYSIPKGRVNLRKAISKHYSESFGLDRPLDFDSEVVISSGANFGIYASLLAFVSKDDEVILIEPFFDQYVRNVTFCGGKPVYVPLRPPTDAGTKNVSSKEWRLNIDELKAAITPKSKVIIINTPHNPVGKVFTIEELNEIGKVAEEHNLFIIADEVYDCLTFQEPHTRIASLSASLWNERITFCSVSPLQEALATGFEIAQKENFFEIQRSEYLARRDTLLKFLDLLGLPYTVPDGSYFVLVESSKIKIPSEFEILELIKNRSRDWHICWFIAKVAGVVCIPPSDFYSSDHVSIGENFIRIAFCKDLEQCQNLSLLDSLYGAGWMFSQ
ncbi:hypothetical protein PSHT_13125 [Puccinia striiformis]|uniref:Aminotransferase class I/classII large domain-containing protein n=1 Tax=Puccinia striiformis TaxID=27350 RepID=A0A2S4USP1_9BASI|nr:hypothetical protein PSHT_13125 [Puccinia striiformis]